MIPGANERSNSKAHIRYLESGHRIHVGLRLETNWRRADVLAKIAQIVIKIATLCHQSRAAQGSRLGCDDSDLWWLELSSWVAGNAPGYGRTAGGSVDEKGHQGHKNKKQLGQRKTSLRIKVGSSMPNAHDAKRMQIQVSLDQEDQAGQMSEP